MTQIADRNDSEFFLKISRGLIEGHSITFVTGINPDVDQTEETVWGQGGRLVYPATGVPMFISSSSAADTGQSILINGLDTNGIMVTQFVDTGGQSQVSIPTNLLRVFTAFSQDSDLAGDLYVAESDTLTNGVPNTAAKIKTKIIQGNNVSRNGFFTIPADKTGYLKDIRGTVGKGKDATINLLIRNEGGVFFNSGHFNLYQSSASFEIGVFAELLPLTDIELSATSTVNSDVTISLDMVLIDN